MRLARPAGDGWLVLIGGGELTFGETEAADRAWIAKLPPAGEVGFVPAASGSADYGRHFAIYLDEYFGRRAEIVPIYRRRDARRGKNRRRLAGAAAIYLGGGVAEQLIGALAGSPCLEAIEERLRDGGVVVAIAAAAQAAGSVVRSLYGGATLAGFGWLAGGVVETNFEPGNDRRLRRLLAHPGVSWGLGIPAGRAVLLGPAGRLETAGRSYWLGSAGGDLEPLGDDGEGEGDGRDDAGAPMA